MWQSLAIAGLACSTLILELVLTRAYSVVFYYHFSFVAVSLAMLGLSAGSVWLFLRPHWGLPERLPLSLARASAAFALTSALCYPLQLYVPNVFKPGVLGSLATLVFLLLACVPFVLSGLAIALLLTQQGPRVAGLYASDLTGAALGCLAVPALLSWTDPSTAIFFSATLAALVACRCHPRTPAPYWALLVILSLVTVVSGARGGIRFPYVKGRADVAHEFEGWNSFSRVTVSPLGSMPTWMSFYNGPRPESLNVRIDAGAGTDIMKCSGNFAELKSLGFDITGLVYQLRSSARVLVLGCGGGRDAATALSFGNHEVTAVEMNDLLVSLLKGRYLDYSGRLASQANIILNEARSYLRDSSDSYDIIQMSLIDTTAAVASGAYLLTEHSLYTVEAWTNILQHLTPTGIFSVTRNRYRGWPLEVDRCLTLGVEALRQLGVSDPRGHVILLEGDYARVNSPNASAGLTTLLFSRQPFSAQDLARARQLEQFGFRERDVARGNFEPERLKILDPASYTAALQEAPVDISAPTDNRPFFFFHLKPGRLLSGDFTALMYTRAMTILPQLLLAVTLLSAILTGVPLAVQKRRPSLSLTLYFAAIGAAFMAIEVGLLQILSIYLGHPLYSMVVVLFSLLLAGGLGSALSPRLGRWRTSVLPALCILIAIISLIYPTLFALSGGAGMRVLISLCLLIPLGLLMGTAFPLGLAQLQRRDPSLAAWCWAVNGAASVITSVLTMLVALILGLQSIFWVGLVAYAVAALVYLRLSRAQE